MEVRCFGLEHLSPAYRICGDAEPLAMYDVYCAHNIHFVIFGAMFSGQYGIAKLHALELKAHLQAMM